MNVGLVKGCLKTELLSVFWHYSRLNHARPQSFSFHDLLYAVAYLPKLTVQDGLRDTVCTGTSSTGCHGAVYLGIHISKVAKLDARLMKTFCIPSVHGQNHEMANHRLNLSYGTQALCTDEMPWSIRPWDIYPNSGLAADVLFFLSVSKEVSFEVRRIQRHWHRVCGLWCLSAHEKLTPG